MPEQNDGTIRIDDARLIFRNFSGAKTQFNREGDRNFCVVIPEDFVETLEHDGWNVKFLQAREEGESPTPYLQVKMKWEFKPPRVVMVKSNGQVNLTEDMVSILDFAELSTVDLIIRPFSYDVNGKSGIAAYLKTMFATINEDELERKYSTGEVVQ